MRIAIDARLNAYRRGGIPEYTRQLLTALAEVGREDQFVSLQHREHLRPLAVAPNVERRTVWTPPHHRFEQWTLPLEVLLVWPDVLHCPDFIAPLRRACPAVVTIHDLAFMHYPEILDDAARAYYGQIKTNATRADGIIAVSETTRQDIAQFLDIPIEEVAVIYEAAAPLFGRLELREGEVRVLGSTPVAADTFMLFVSTLEPRKNLPTLLHALRICLDRRPDRPYRLVVAGGRGWRDEAIFAATRDLRLGEHVLFVGAVGQYDLRWLYNACRLYINPSLYEGFGLPLLEAMACGAACLAGATSSLPEIGGDAAIYIPPLDAGQWAEAIEVLWDDQERREELGRLGRVQAQHFSWMRAARETLKVYERARARALPKAALAAPRPSRIGEQQEPLETPGSSSVAAPGVSAEARACLRCGTALLAGQIQHALAAAQLDSPDARGLLATRAWFCPRCGQVELVAEQATNIAPELVPSEAAPEAMTAVLEDPEVITSSDGIEIQVAAAQFDQPPAAQLEAEDEAVALPESDLAQDDGPRAAAALPGPAVEPAAPVEAPLPEGEPAHGDASSDAAADAVAELTAAELEYDGTNGTLPPAAERPVAPEAIVLPAKRRQTRSKRKRSP